MNIGVDAYIDYKKFLYGNILKFIEDIEANNEDTLQVLIEIIKPHELDQVLRIILSISYNHQRDEVFFEKIYQILFSLKDQIKQTYSNLDIFNIFRRNKKILLFLIKNEIITYNETINKAILSEHEINGIPLCHFFLPEIKAFTDEETYKKIESQLTEDELNKYDEKRLLGENDTYICELIRNDAIDEFVSYLNRRNFSFSSKIKLSIFETNSFLNENHPTLIEYAAFFGSIQIFNFLKLSQVELTSDLWIYSIHSKNAELIHILESNSIQPYSYELCLMESIKCHHNDIAHYIEDNLLDVRNTENIIESSLQSYNYEFIPTEMKENYILSYLCQYDYLNLVDAWLDDKKEEINDYIENIISFIQKAFKSSRSYALSKAATDNRIDVIYYLLSNLFCINKNELINCKNLNTIVIPFSVKSIESNAFNLCSSLTQVIIPSSVTSIGDRAFKECSSLTQIAIPSSVISIGSLAFNKCSSLTQIAFSIPSSITSIGDNAFSECISLKQISIPSSVTSIGNGAFGGCISLVQITIPSVTKIRYDTFIFCRSLKSFTIPPSVTSIESDCFSFTSLTNIVIPSSITKIEDKAFQRCFFLKSVSIPSFVTSIGNYAFCKCLSLEQITIPSSVTSIGNFAFKECSYLTHISIPSSVTNIGYGAFSYCSSLVQITIPSSVTSIGNYAFRECSYLAHISIPSSVTNIGYGAFSYCSSLVQITIPSSVTIIEQYAFYKCSSLTQVTIPSSLKSIGENTFKDCPLLQQIQIPSTTKIVKKHVNNCKIS